MGIHRTIRPIPQVSGGGTIIEHPQGHALYIGPVAMPSVTTLLVANFKIFKRSGDWMCLAARCVALFLTCPSSEDFALFDDRVHSAPSALCIGYNERNKGTSCGCATCRWCFNNITPPTKVRFATPRSLFVQSQRHVRALTSFSEVCSFLSSFQHPHHGRECQSYISSFLRVCFL